MCDEVQTSELVGDLSEEVERAEARHMITHTTQEPREEQVGSSWSSPCIFHFVDVCLKYFITIISIDNSLIYRYSDACSMYNLHSLIMRSAM